MPPTDPTAALRTAAQRLRKSFGAAFPAGSARTGYPTHMTRERVVALNDVEDFLYTLATSQADDPSDGNWWIDKMASEYQADDPSGPDALDRSEPLCNAEHPDWLGRLCARSRGHSGDHGTASGVRWPAALRESPDGE